MVISQPTTQDDFLNVAKKCEQGQCRCTAAAAAACSKTHPLSPLQISQWIAHRSYFCQSVCVSNQRTGTSTRLQSTDSDSPFNLFVVFRKSSLVTTHKLNNCSNISTLRIQCQSFYLKISRHQNL